MNDLQGLFRDSRCSPYVLKQPRVKRAEEGTNSRAIQRTKGIARVCPVCTSDCR